MAWHDMANRMLGVAVRTFKHASPSGDMLVKYIPASGSTFRVAGVFKRSHMAIDPATGAPISSNNPILGIRLSDFPCEPRKGDKVAVGDVVYRVVDMQNDGVAGALLELQK